MSDHHYLAKNAAGWERGKTPAEALKKLHDHCEAFRKGEFWQHPWICYRIPTPMPRFDEANACPRFRSGVDGLLMHTSYDPVYDPSPLVRHPTGEAAQ